jgi:predicted transcriptional regulator/transcriptional regulator with XRE-family HTH domain
MHAVKIGGKIRRLRQDRRITQVQMATELGISASYLNLIESNQRPVTVRVLLKLAERFQLDLADLSTEDDARLEAELMEVFASPLFDASDVKTSDVRELVAALPAVGRAVRDFYRLSVSRGAFADPSEIEAAPVGIPSEEVTDFLQKRLNFFPTLEDAADALWRDHGLGLHSLQQDLIRFLHDRHRITVDVLPQGAMSGMLRMFEPRHGRLMLSEMLPPHSRVFQIAHQIALIEARAEIDAILDGEAFASSDARNLARVALANYIAAAIVMPYGPFRTAAIETRHDLTTLQHRFGASFEQVCHRLTTLRRPDEEGVPFHLIRVDIAGNISKRFSASGIQIARFGAACPRWNVYDAFATPGLIRVQLSRMPDGQTFFCVARTIEHNARLAAGGGLPSRAGTQAIGLGCALHHAKSILYADGLDLEDPQRPTPIGVSCRTCPRENCIDRAMPSLHQRLRIDENRRGLTTYVGAA